MPSTDEEEKMLQSLANMFVPASCQYCKLLVHFPCEKRTIYGTFTLRKCNILQLVLLLTGTFSYTLVLLSAHAERFSDLPYIGFKKKYFDR